MEVEMELMIGFVCGVAFTLIVLRLIAAKLDIGFEDWKKRNKL